MRVIYFLTFFISSMFALFAFAAEDRAPEQAPDVLRSVLDQQVIVPNVGTIAYRAPLPEKTGPLVVLVHGVYGGASHRAFRELYPYLDAKGFRVYLFDLLGAGDSEKPKQKYDIEKLDSIIEGFLVHEVKQPSIVVAESLAGVSVLEVSKRQPNLVQKIVLLQPTGVNTLARSANEREQTLFDQIWNNEEVGLSFYQRLLAPESVEKYLKRSVYNDSLIDTLRIQESSMMRQNVEQRWLTFSFVGNQIWRRFDEAVKGVKVPVLGIFGANAEPIGDEDSGVERAAEFKAIFPAMDVQELKDTGASVQRERPQEVADLIQFFAS